MLFVLMLEDDRERIQRFRAILRRHDGGVEVGIHRTAGEFIAAFGRLESPPSLIALDHDLFTDHESDPDPGDGRDVARYLAERRPMCPVLIHSSNAPAADSMLFTLRDANWEVDRIAPIGGDWIETYWYPIALDMMVGRA